MNEDDLPDDDNSPFFASKSVREKRRVICDTCPEKSQMLGVCKICYCVVVNKTAMKNAKCPIDKW